MLPSYGGTAQVWTTCIVFFQTALLFGYLYAHILRRLTSPFVSGLVHFVSAACGLLLVNLGSLSSATGLGHMGFAIFYQLSAAIGLAFCSLAATGPLVQSWHATQYSERDTYRLYAWSNCGSMLALVSYPFAVERLGMSVQQTAWTIGYILYLVMLCLSVWQSRGVVSWIEADRLQELDDAQGVIKIVRWLSWAILASIGSVILIASTNVLCQEVASHPFLWVLPLTMYLLSFIVAFEKPNWYRRRIVHALFTASVFAAILLFHLGTNAGLVAQLIGFATITFIGTFICHGELYRMRPGKDSLTSFYLSIAAGGAIGGLGTAFIPPVLFNGYFEFQVGLLACLLFSSMIVGFEYFSVPKTCLRNSCSQVFMLMVAAMPVICSLVFYLDKNFHKDLLFQGRNHYGIVAVTEDEQFRRMINGQTHHGGQFVDQGRRNEPSAYYSSGSGVDVAFQIARKRRKARKAEQVSPVGLNVGVIGLGTGAMLSYRSPDDLFRFYEINPMVESVAREYFDI